MKIRREGFTLIELMVVAGIMVLVTAIVVSSTFGMTRASGYTAAENVVYNTLQLAHQKACTDGKRVVVAFVGDQDEYGDNSLTAIEAVGTVSEEDAGNYIQDRCANMAKYTKDGKKDKGESSNDTVWNLETGAKVKSFTIQIKEVPGSIPGTTKDRFSYTVTQLNPKAGGSGSFSGWKKGAPYGFQIIPVQVLPLGFKIGMGAVGTSPASSLIVFEPNGSSFRANANGMTKAADVAELWIYEEIAKDDKDRAIRIRVDKGVVKVVKR